MNNHRTRFSLTPAWSVALVAPLMMLAVSTQAAPAKKTTYLPACNTTQTAQLFVVPLGKSVILNLQDIKVLEKKKMPAGPAVRIIEGNPVGETPQSSPQQAPVDTKASVETSGRVTKIIDSRDLKAATERPATLSNDTIAVVGMRLLKSIDQHNQSGNEIYLYGKSVGSTNITVVSEKGICTIIDIAVEIDTKTLESRLNQFFPGSAIKVTAAADSIVLSGMVADATQVERVMRLASAYSGKGSEETKVINMLTVADAQQVMLEVKVAEISKTLVDKLGAKFNLPKINGSWTYSVLSDFLNDSPGVLSAAKGNQLFSLDAEKRDGLVKILAEPTIMAISGQEGSFLAGGIILIPTNPRYDIQTGTVSSSLEEKEFGVALKFTPTVLASGRINLKVRPEVSELSPNGVTIHELGTVNNSILPLINIRKAETTVQLHDGQSFAIGGLVKNNVTQNIKAFPILGEIPIIGALFRSSDFQTDKTELVFIVTPHLVKPLPPDYPLPTDNFVPPSRTEFFLGGKMEGTPPPADQNAPAPGNTQPAASGFELK